MKKKILSFLLAALMVFSCAVVNAQEALTQQEEASDYTNAFKKSMIRVYAHDIADNYYYGVSDAQLLYSVICSAIEEGKVDLNKALEAMIKTLDDKYAAFYTAEEYAEMAEDISGEFSGIGVVITQHEKGVLVNSVMKDSPAEKSGIIQGDYIIAVNGTSTVGMPIDEVKKLIVGVTDTTVTVRVLRRGEEFDVVCTRATVQISNIETRMINDNVAYLGIVQFAKNTPDEIKEYIKEIQKNRVGKLVIDLRNNPGGDLDAAVEIANIFISAGRIAELRYKDESLNTFIKSKNYNAPRLKMVVLVNEHSASASEFLATAFQTRGAAKILGKKTFGKGSMQTFKRTANGSGIKYTIGEFFSAKGERIHTVGITPDIVVENEVISVDEESFVDIDYTKIGEAGKDGEMNLALEQRLCAVGLLDKADEVFDDATVQAVKDLQLALGYDVTGVAGFYEYLYLNDFDYSFDTVIDKQLDAAVGYLEK